MAVPGSWAQPVFSSSSSLTKFVPSPSAFHWKYTRDVPAAGGGSSKVGFDDWFWLQDKRTMIAHASLAKLGVEVATLNAFYQKDIMEDQTPRKRRSISRKEGQQASDNTTKVANSLGEERSPEVRALRKARQDALTGTIDDGVG
ncbi:DUF3833 family protein [Rhizobium cauense]|uniref:DUF3833 family protein n=1 Tax=Rhizobium cauense TaxID=1166683 RepID=UPI001C6E48B7|nr:DUF3833 family protein [Rhizobium cauense]MBW9115555.1 DUF3833 family protein [Rhizobium cauense]